jgi:hypothetical protein
LIDGFGVRYIKWGDRQSALSFLLDDLVFGFVGFIDVSTCHDNIHDRTFGEMLNNTITDSLVTSGDDNGFFFIFHKNAGCRKKIFIYFRKALRIKE